MSHVYDQVTLDSPRTNNKAMQLVKDLSEREKKNVYLAVACGCFEDIHNRLPGADHTKQKREIRQFREAILYDIAPRLPAVAQHNMKLFRDTIIASDRVLREIVSDSEQRIHVLLNLAGFCLNELPVRDRHWVKYNKLFGMWDDAYKYDDVRSGDRIFERINAEVQILVAQRGGLLR